MLRSYKPSFRPPVPSRSLKFTKNLYESYKKIRSGQYDKREALITGLSSLLILWLTKNYVKRGIIHQEVKQQDKLKIYVRKCDLSRAIELPLQSLFIENTLYKNKFTTDLLAKKLQTAANKAKREKVIFTQIQKQDFSKPDVMKWLKEEFGEINLNEEKLKEKVIAFVKNEVSFKFVLQEEQVNFQFLVNFLVGPPKNKKTNTSIPTVVFDKPYEGKLGQRGKMFRKMFYECSHDLRGAVDFREYSYSKPRQTLTLTIQGSAQEFAINEVEPLQKSYEAWKSKVESLICNRKSIEITSQNLDFYTYCLQKYKPEVVKLVEKAQEDGQFVVREEDLRKSLQEKLKQLNYTSKSQGIFML